MLGMQRQVLSRGQAFASGVTASGVQHRTRRGGPWQRLLPGVYLTTSGAPTLEQLAVAAVLYAGPNSLLTGAAALRAYRMQAPESHQVDVLVPASRQPASRDYVVIHRTQRMPASVGCDGVLRLAPEARAVADAARSLRDLSEVRAVVAGAVQQRRCRIEDLAAELREGPIRGSAQLRKVMQEVIDGIRSPAEADLRRLIITSGLPRPLFNPDLYVGGQFLARPDAWWPDAAVAVEIDSRRWLSARPSSRRPCAATPGWEPPESSSCTSPRIRCAPSRAESCGTLPARCRPAGACPGLRSASPPDYPSNAVSIERADRTPAGARDQATSRLTASPLASR